MISIVRFTGNEAQWDNYVQAHPRALVYHQIGWKRVIENTFGHQGHYFLALKNGNIKGILPLFLMQSRIFGSHLISLPFLDRAGILADDDHIAALLCDKAIALAREEQVDFLEIRNEHPLDHNDLKTVTHKAAFVLPLHNGLENIWKKGLKKNVKNKIRIALKNQVEIKIDDTIQFVEDFYKVYCINMKFLGTPVYPKEFFLNMRKEFAENIKIFLAFSENNLIGAKILFFFKDTLYFIIQASLRKYVELHPNNLLYWTAIEYAYKHEMKYCDMGRSNIDSGPYNFKKQWGPEIYPLYWQYYLYKSKQIPRLNPTNPKFSLAINIWKRLPLWLTRLVGPLISKHIP
jgi:FemAB-related protein (PEP-CTERM system-associated)